MKLMVEDVDLSSIEYLKESSEDSKEKHWYITGPFMQVETKNRNGRIYPKKIMEREVEKYRKEMIETHRAMGELDHPETPTINLDRVSHIIESLEFDGNDIIGKAKILDTPMGRIAQSLLDGGVKLGVSSRGLGTLNEEDNTTVNDDYQLVCVDIVGDPSAQSAYVNGIMENKEYIIKGDSIVEKAVENLEESLAKHGSKEILDDLKMFLHDINMGR